MLTTDCHLLEDQATVIYLTGLNQEKKYMR